MPKFTPGPFFFWGGCTLRLGCCCIAFNSSDTATTCISKAIESSGIQVSDTADSAALPLLSCISFIAQRLISAQLHGAYCHYRYKIAAAVGVFVFGREAEVEIGWKVLSNCIHYLWKPGLEIGNPT
ncbi:hypothetical protein FGIG_12042 [Fasciola gigantica]|uniref:Uncharacterized protein n=1 Tax=Fasciola gigantica TaxID=46835 RepID=A0A504YII9_FASGI|nr:hypothetical protein FGIG_12042 [Fasciola gigantica]